MGPVAAVLVSLRPRQWAKNLFVFAGVIFSQQLFTSQAWRAVAAFALFCALSGAIYLLNDVADAEKDRLHPTKRRRPVASGALSRRLALGIGVALLAASVAVSFGLGVPFGLVAVSLRGAPHRVLRLAEAPRHPRRAHGGGGLRAPGGGGRGGGGRGHLGVAADLHRAHRALPRAGQAPPRVPHAEGEPPPPIDPSWPSTARGSSTR